MKTFEDFRSEIIETIEVTKSHAQIETMAAEAYSNQQLAEYKEKLKSRIIFWNAASTEDEPCYSYKSIFELINTL